MQFSRDPTPRIWSYYLASKEHAKISSADMAGTIKFFINCPLMLALLKHFLEVVFFLLYILEQSVMCEKKSSLQAYFIGTARVVFLFCV